MPEEPVARDQSYMTLKCAVLRRGVPTERNGVVLAAQRHGGRWAVEEHSRAAGVTPAELRALADEMERLEEEHGA